MTRPLLAVILVFIVFMLGFFVSTSRRTEAAWATTANAMVVSWTAETFGTPDVRLLQCKPHHPAVYRCTLLLGPVIPRQVVTVDCNGETLQCETPPRCEK